MALVGCGGIRSRFRLSISSTIVACSIFCVGLDAVSPCCTRVVGGLTLRLLSSRNVLDRLSSDTCLLSPDPLWSRYLPRGPGAVEGSASYVRCRKAVFSAIASVSTSCIGMSSTWLYPGVICRCSLLRGVGKGKCGSCGVGGCVGSVVEGIDHV